MSVNMFTLMSTACIQDIELAGYLEIELVRHCSLANLPEQPGIFAGFCLSITQRDTNF